MKELTGGDPIRARRMREDFWQFWPTHKVVLACNHKPTVRGTDNAIWRRIKLVPFKAVIPKEQRDRELSVKLQTERSGILAWMMRGCLDWQRNELGEPMAVIAATSDYASEEDKLGNGDNGCEYILNIKYTKSELTHFERLAAAGDRRDVKCS